MLMLNLLTLSWKALEHNYAVCRIYLSLCSERLWSLDNMIILPRTYATVPLFMYFSGKDRFWQVTDAFLRHLALIWFNWESTNFLTIPCLRSIPLDECIVIITSNIDTTTTSWCYELVLYHFFGDAHTFTQVYGIRHGKITKGSPWSGTLQSW